MIRGSSEALTDNAPQRLNLKKSAAYSNGVVKVAYDVVRYLTKSCFP